MTEEKQIIEINGIRMEVDLRNAKRIDTFKVGDRVKLLKKNYDSYSVYRGVIVDFEAFDSLPTITVAYIEETYSTADVKIVHINKNTKEVELVLASGNDEVQMTTKSEILAKLDRDIEKKQLELKEIESRKQYLLKRFDCWFEEPQSWE